MKKLSTFLLFACILQCHTRVPNSNLRMKRLLHQKNPILFRSDSAPTITKIDALQTVNDAKNRIRELHRKLTGRDEDSHIDAIKKKFRELSQRDGRPFHKLSKVYDNPDRMFKRPKFLNSRHGAIGGSIIAKPAANEEDLQKRTTDRVVQPKHLY